MKEEKQPNFEGKKGETEDSIENPFFIVKDVSVYSEIPLKDRVKVLLLRKGMSQNQLADKIGIAIGTMSKIVNGTWIPTSQIKLKMAQELECDSLVIFGGKEYWNEWREKIKYLDYESKKTKGEIKE